MARQRPKPEVQVTGPVPFLQAPSFRVPLHSTDGRELAAGSLPDS